MAHSPCPALCLQAPGQGGGLCPSEHWASMAGPQAPAWHRCSPGLGGLPSLSVSVYIKNECACERRTEERGPRRTTVTAPNTSGCFYNHFRHAHGGPGLPCHCIPRGSSSLAQPGRGAVWGMQDDELCSPKGQERPTCCHRPERPLAWMLGACAGLGTKVKAEGTNPGHQNNDKMQLGEPQGAQKGQRGLWPSATR